MEQNVIQINSGIMIYVNVSAKSKKDVRNPATCNCENRKYLASIMDDSVITCEEIIEPYIEKINFNEKKGICKIQNFCILLAFSFHYYGIIDSC